MRLTGCPIAFGQMLCGKIASVMPKIPDHEPAGWDHALCHMLLTTMKLVVY